MHHIEIGKGDLIPIILFPNRGFIQRETTKYTIQSAYVSWLQCNEFVVFMLKSFLMVLKHVGQYKDQPNGTV